MLNYQEKGNHACTIQRTMLGDYPVQEKRSVRPLYWEEKKGLLGLS